MRTTLLVFSVFATNFAFTEQVAFPLAQAPAQMQGWHGLRFDTSAGSVHNFAQQPVRVSDENTLFFSSEFLDVALNEKGFESQLLPVQAPVRKSATQIPTLRKNANAYLQNSFTERDLVDVEDLGIMKDRRFAQLNILPVLYLASENVVRVYYFIEFEVIFDKKKADTDNQSVSAIENKTKYNIPTTKTVPNPKIYKTISDRMFQDELVPFVNWKREIGFDVWVSYTDQPEVGNTTTSIKAYLQGIYESENRADYLLLVGDTDEIPAFPTRLPAENRGAVAYIDAETPSRATIRLISMLGQPVASTGSVNIKTGKNEFQLDLFNLPRGIYVCTYFDGVRVVSRKIVW